MSFIGDDENVKALRETAREIGLVDLLEDLRREHLHVLEVLDRNRARLTQALMLLGMDEGEAGGAA